MNNEWENGLPNVGVECEGLPVDSNDQWHKVIYVAPDPVIRGAKFFIGVYLGGDRSGKVDYFKCFRPIKSKAENLRDKQISLIKAAHHEYCNSCWTWDHNGRNGPSPDLGAYMYDKGCRMTRELTRDVINKINIEANKYPPSQMYESELRAINLTAQYVSGEIDL